MKTKRQILLDKLGFGPPQYVKGRASIADLFAPDRRCGIYVLHFSTGEFYAGQAIDVTRRYVQHRFTHKDIEKISFKAVGLDCLDEEERRVIWELETGKRPLRNVIFTSLPKGECDFDLIMSAQEQGEWLKDPNSVEDTCERLSDPNLRRKFRKAFERFVRTPYAHETIDVLSAYVRVGIPVIRRTEASFWGLSCMPRHRIPIYARVNVFWQEVFAAFQYKHTLWFSMHVALSPLKDAFGRSLRSLHERHPLVDHTNHRYEPGGQDQTSFEFPDAAAKAFITDTDIASAIRLFNLRLMKKGACIYGRFHCMDLADWVMGDNGHRDSASHDGRVKS